ncbi:MAG: uroporphyrinogen decarboxylase family protein [Oscillospiraceae bacterium]
MIDLDIEQFWKDDSLSHDQNCFSKTAPQVAMGIRMSNECVFAELGEQGEPWGYTDPERQLEFNKRYNDKAEKIVGKRLLSETLTPKFQHFPQFKSIGEIFGGEYVYDGHMTWLKGNCSTPQELEKQLDIIDQLDFKSAVFPSDWEIEKKRIFEEYGVKPPLYTAVRGPVTLATSLYSADNLVFLMYDEPEIAKRLFDTIARVIKQYISLFAEEAGYSCDNFLHGFSFYDDDCNLLSPDLYQEYGYPVLKSVFEYASPNPNDWRYQHSDSAMGHLLPILSKLDLTACNFGPTLTVREIRRYMPKTRIDGLLAPFTFMSNDEEKIMAEVKRDCEMAKENDLRGLNIATAGSINNGSLLTSMRAVMAAIQNYGRY